MFVSIVELNGFRFIGHTDIYMYLETWPWRPQSIFVTFGFTIFKLKSQLNRGNQHFMSTKLLLKWSVSLYLPFKGHLLSHARSHEESKPLCCLLVSHQLLWHWNSFYGKDSLCKEHDYMYQQQQRCFLWSFVSERASVRQWTINYTEQDLDSLKCEISNRVVNLMTTKEIMTLSSVQNDKFPEQPCIFGSSYNNVFLHDFTKICCHFLKSLQNIFHTFFKITRKSQERFFLTWDKQISLSFNIETRQTCQ